MFWNWNYQIISPLCQICKQLYNIVIKKESDKNIFEISCKCENKSYSLNEFENKINNITCEKCKKTFKQINIFQDFLSEDILCEKCLQEKNSFDFIRFKEIPYICSIHKNNYDSYCDKCGKFFCNSCKIFGNHNIIKIQESQITEEKYSIFENSKWFLNLKNKGFFNLNNFGKICDEPNKNIIEEFDKYIVKIENKEQKTLLDLSNDLKFKSYFYFTKINDLEKTLSNYLSQIKLEDKIYNLENKMNTLTISINVLLKEFNDKNKIVQLVKTRNILQHLLANMIRENSECFEEIKSDFRILYESYKYLNYEKKNSEQVKEKIESIFERTEKLVKNHIKRKVKEKLFANFLVETKERKSNMTKITIENNFYNNDNENKNFKILIDSIIPKFSDCEKNKIFNRVFDNPFKKKVDNIKFHTIEKYNEFLEKQGFFKDKKTNKLIKKYSDIKTEIENIKKNEINEECYKMDLYRTVNLTNDNYFDEFGYVNENTLNQNLIKEIFDNNRKSGNYQYLLIKKEKENELLKNVCCKNDAEFYFVFILANKLINRISRIIHQNDAIFQFLFYNIENNLNIKDYTLFMDKNNKEIKFIGNKQKRIDSLKKFNQENISFSSFINNMKDF